mgnify:CR=1 FL=1
MNQNPLLCQRYSSAPLTAHTPTDVPRESYSLVPPTQRRPRGPGRGEVRGDAEAVAPGLDRLLDVAPQRRGALAQRPAGPRRTGAGPQPFFFVLNRFFPM